MGKQVAEEGAVCDARFLDLGWAQCDLQWGAPSLGMARGFDVDDLGNEAISDAMWQALNSWTPPPPGW